MSYSTIFALGFYLSLPVIFTLFAIGYNPARAFVGGDGSTYIAVFEAQKNFIGVSPDIYTNFLQGLGNLSLPTNFSLLPGYWLEIIDSSGAFTPAASYAFFAVVLFAAVLLTGWNHRFPRGVSYGAAWILLFLLFPYFRNISAVPIIAGGPHFVLVFLLAALADTALKRLGTGGWLRSAACTLLLIATLLAGLIIMPVFLTVMGPYILLMGLYALYAASSHRERIHKFASALLVLALAGALGWLEYWAGLMLDTAYGFFYDQMQQSEITTRSRVSIVFQGHFVGRFMGMVLFIAASLGALAALISRDRRFRHPAFLLLGVQFFLLALGAWAEWNPGRWPGPVPLYFELPFLPLYALFAACAVGTLLNRIMRAFPRGHSFTSLPLVKASMAASLVALVALYILLAIPPERDHKNFTLPPASTKLTSVLESEIVFRPGDAFAGRVASVIPDLEFWPQFNYVYGIDAASGNDHQAYGLWLKGIPTLTEYNVILTPGFYWLVKHFLTAPEVQQVRNWTNFSRVDLPMLRLLGVRFILSPLSDIAGAAPRGTLEFPDSKKPLDPLHLFELKGANLAGVSVKKLVGVNSLEQAETVMKAPGFDGTAAIAFPPLPEETTPWVPATESEILIEKRAFRIRARSAGRTMLVLPIEFSRCLEITPVSGAMPQVLRVNVALAGLIFDREVDARLVQRTGPLTRPRCRLRDYRDFRAMLEPS